MVQVSFYHFRIEHDAGSDEDNKGRLFASLKSFDLCDIWQQTAFPWRTQLSFNGSSLVSTLQAGLADARSDVGQLSLYGNN
jgi:hypothetical protein